MNALTIRNKAGLHPDMLPHIDALERNCKDAGLELLIYCTLRPADEQARLFRVGRSLHDIQERANVLAAQHNRPDLSAILLGVGPQYGKRKLTNAAPGQSMHQYGLAFDAVPLVNGKIIYGNEAELDDEIEDSHWKLYGACTIAAGLEWAGSWRGRMREMPHSQMPGISWRDLISRPIEV